VTERYDLIVIGGGIVGLATAYQMLLRKPDLRLCLLEKESELGIHQTGHNSGVLHAGLYYPPGSRKARLCHEGKRALQIFADEHGIPYELCGKLVVALDDSELDRLANIRERAIANGVEDLEEVGPERIREIEPHAAGIRALWSPRSGIIDFRRVALAYAEEVRSRGGTILTSQTVRSIHAGTNERIVYSASHDPPPASESVDHDLPASVVTIRLEPHRIHSPPFTRISPPPSTQPSGAVSTLHELPPSFVSAMQLGA